ncbi:unnamed protein product [Kuraishia capsulata CBS 1993]|uniref:ethanolamine-phosphate cytidylyltransferase n=1 Tax=Kuraishia capsulata CBS 1993 TaxID=1382522 RepID=W6MQT8_9ASCO|nr:uncharacterized protein KUCA_T00004702001 [Kuraishia capsulata CBS 1993]CDK28718.1 unnamed protein product [Kuraishia capsulata CBS 1993]
MGVLISRIMVRGFCFVQMKFQAANNSGHAGAMLQARQLGKELYVGVHSDEEILENKGPVVMHLAERVIAVQGCKWCTECVPNAPYVTDPDFMKAHGCNYVVHGDDITTDANGEDCYRVVKDLGMFLVVKRTPNISTTDLVGRMLVLTKSHHIPSITPYDWLSYKTDKESLALHTLLLNDSVERFQMYSSAEDGLSPGSAVFVYTPEDQKLNALVNPESQKWSNSPKIYYIDGGFDLFNPGHIIALRMVKEMAAKEDALVLVGLNDDTTINKAKGLNFPVMNLFERSLCVLQSKYVDGLILGVPSVTSLQFLKTIPGEVVKVCHGPTADVDSYYSEVKAAGLYLELGPHEYDDMSTEVIINRVLDNRKSYEERQRKKGWKSEIEKQLLEQEKTA